MAIPKVIHYCWFGNNPQSRSVKKCIDSWKRFCPDYRIIEWNEDNYPVENNLYCKQAYECKKWAFATDYARLWIIYNYGGIYLDTDVELIKPLDDLLNFDCFIGRQPGFQVNTGAGFGACKHHSLIKRMMDDYSDISFIKADGEFDLLTCPQRNSQWLFDNGLKKDNSFQEIANACIYPIEYFSPKDAWSRKIKITKNTYSIHHCSATWNDKETKSEHLKRYIVCKVKNANDQLIHLPNKFIRLVIGKNNYEKGKNKLKGDD